MTNTKKTTAIYDSSNPNWGDSPEYNRLFLKSQENYYNDLLLARGHVFLNEVLKGLGLIPLREGQIVGWKRGSKIEFHIDQQENRIILSFDVDGDILDELD